MKYPFRVYRTQVEDHVFWVADCPALKGCTAQGDTIEEACSVLAENEEIWLETAAECGIEIPPVPLEHMTDCSGKFTVRIAPYVHKEATENAKRQGVSLNQYVNDAIVAQNSRLSVIGYIVPEVKFAVDSIKHFLRDARSTNSSGEAHISIWTQLQSNSLVNITN